VNVGRRAGQVGWRARTEIALNTDDVEAAMRQVAGTARSMGVLIHDE